MINKDNEITTFTILRHGQTSYNAEGRIQGWLDIPLSETGEEQARRLANELQEMQFDIAYSSDLQHAWRTVAIVIAQRQIAHLTDTLLGERNFGSLEGKPSSLLQSDFLILKICPITTIVPTDLAEYLKTMRNLYTGFSHSSP